MEDAIYMLVIGIRYGLAIFVFIYCICSFIFKPKEKSLLYFAAYLITFVLSSMVEQPLLVERIFKCTNMLYWLKVTHSLTSIFLMFFLNSVMGVTMKKYFPIYIISIIIISISLVNIVFLPTHIPIVFEVARFTTYAGGIIYAPIAYIKEKKGDRKGLFLSVAFMTSIIFILFEMLKNILMTDPDFKNDIYYLVLYMLMTGVIGVIYTFLLKTIFSERINVKSYRKH